MDVRNCRGCGRLFNYLSGPDICPACKDEAEKKFQAVKDFIRENPRASIQEIADENGVTTNQIHQWIREERLEFASGAVTGITCEKCGASILTGRFCKNCKGAMANALNDTFAKKEAPAPEPKKKSGDKMFHL